MYQKMRDANEFLKKQAMEKLMQSFADEDPEVAFHSLAKILNGYLDKIGRAVLTSDAELPFLVAALEMHLKKIRKIAGAKGCEIAEGLVRIFYPKIYTVEICPDGEENE